jgi:ArsR family transcriptional regulator, lead/cadmium/zinc/bismuth-responsive transcriptional repressor
MKSRNLTCSDPMASVTGKPPIQERPLLTPDQATEVVALFQALANDSRLRLLHALARAEELCVTDLAAAVEMTPQAVSNQLRRLIDRRIVATRREGNHIYYRIIDPCVPGLLSRGLCLAEETGRLPDLTHAPPPSRGKSPAAARRQTSRANGASKTGRARRG